MGKSKIVRHEKTTYSVIITFLSTKVNGGKKVLVPEIGAPEKQQVRLLDEYVRQEHVLKKFMKNGTDGTSVNELDLGFCSRSLQTNRKIWRRFSKDAVHQKWGTSSVIDSFSCSIRLQDLCFTPVDHARV